MPRAPMPRAPTPRAPMPRPRAPVGSSRRGPGPGRIARTGPAGQTSRSDRVNAARNSRPCSVTRALAPRSTTTATPTTCAPASRRASTAVSEEAPVVDVSSTARTRRPATSGPSIRRCRPCCFSAFRTTNASIGVPPPAALACIIAVATGSAPSVRPPTASYSRSRVRSSMTRPASGATRPSSRTRRRSMYQSACWPEERMKSPRTTALALIAARSSARSLTAGDPTPPGSANAQKGSLAERTSPTLRSDNPATRRKDGAAVDRCALFVDAGYVLGDGAMAVHGTRRAESVSWDYEGLLSFFAGLVTERTGLPLLRCYWYEATVDGRRTAEQDALADMPGIKLRVAKIRPGRREGVETEIHRDLTTLARNNAISDALVVSAEEDLAQVIADVQDLGMRVTLVHIAVDGNWTISRSLRQESDDIIEISGDHLRPYVELIAGAEPAHADEDAEQVGQGSRPMSNGHSTAAAASYQPMPSSGNHAPPSIYTAPVVAEYQRPALQLPRTATREPREGRDARDDRSRDERAREERAPA